MLHYSVAGASPGHVATESLEVLGYPAAEPSIIIADVISGERRGCFRGGRVSPMVCVCVDTSDLAALSEALSQILSVSDKSML